MITRRRLIGSAVAVTVLASISVNAIAQRALRRIGILHERTLVDAAGSLDAFERGMQDLGYTKGKDYTLELRFGEADLARLSTLAAELVALKVDVIVTSGTPSAFAARDASRQIPVITTAASDPVGSGLAATWSRPGGNVTGLTQGVGSEIYTKRLDLLKEIVPSIRRVGFLYNPENQNDVVSLKHFELDCVRLGLTSIRASLRKQDEIQSAFANLQREKVQGMLVTNASTNSTWRKEIAESAIKYRVPAVYGIAPFADAGGLIAYAANVPELYRRAASYADKIFKGANPAETPIEQASRFELIVNLKAAKALGISIPHALILRADRVIQ